MTHDNKKTDTVNTNKIDWQLEQIYYVKEQVNELKLGPLKIWFRGVNSEIWLAHQNAPESNSSKSDAVKEHELKWSRWALNDSNIKITIKPCLPERSLVVRPDHDFRLLPGSSAKIFVRVPLSLKIVSLNQQFTLTEINSVQLSNTWFGSFTEGELCYWISATARRTVFIDSNASHLCICPIIIKNSASEDLLVQRIRLLTKALTLYAKDGQVWSSTTCLTYKGGDEASQIDVKAGAPEDASEARLLTLAQDTNQKNIAARAFGRLFDFAGL